ncbi:Flp family type IVb pilin [Geomonas anaerohicana]|uniref:Flp family type IVb pilin n=1 Tax=Geomonas anaerohicana TaxID=2798583 RepID=A0ABS0YGV4_9BACT|nr:Flp family type IVb pilin [Geomonas anaerohicana]MBJ6751364.1 Flp family type IVb pilin [Geomonas anaerohicana]
MEKLTKMYVQMQTKLQDQKGATMVEYGLMVALIAVVAMVAVGTLGGEVRDAFTDVTNKIKTPGV